MDQELTGRVNRVVGLLQQRRFDELKEMLGRLYPADMAELLEELSEQQRSALVALLSNEAAAETIAELELEDQAALIEHMDAARTADIVGEMSADDAADLVAELSPRKAGEILRMMAPEDASELRELLEYDPHTAGGRMTTEFVAVPVGLSAQGAIDALRRMAPDAETTYYVYAVGPQEQLQGVLSLRELIIAQPDTPIARIMRTSVLSVHVNDDQEVAANLVKKYNLLAVPVVDDDQVLRGIITVDDVLDVLEEEATEDMYRAAGVGDDGDDHETTRGFWHSVKARLPWLLSLLILSLVSGSIIERYSDVLAAITGISFFITTMAGGSGNAATQALTVAVRGMATGEFDSAEIWRVVLREIKLGLTIGAISGVILAGIAEVLFDNPWIGLIVGVSIFLNLTLAKFAGSLVPIVIKRVGFDPAVASGPFIATVTDTTSMLIYFTITTLVLTAAGYL